MKPYDQLREYKTFMTLSYKPSKIYATIPNVHFCLMVVLNLVHNYSWGSTRMSSLPRSLIYLHAENHEQCTGRIGASIGDRIINLRFADDIVVMAEEEEKASGIVTSMDTACTGYQKLIGNAKQKLRKTIPGLVAFNL